MLTQRRAGSGRRRVRGARERGARRRAGGRPLELGLRGGFAASCPPLASDPPPAAARPAPELLEPASVPTPRAAVLGEQDVSRGRSARAAECQRASALRTWSTISSSLPARST